MKSEIDLENLVYKGSDDDATNVLISGLMHKYCKNTIHGLLEFMQERIMTSDLKVLSKEICSSYSFCYSVVKDECDKIKEEA